MKLQKLQEYKSTCTERVEGKNRQSGIKIVNEKPKGFS